MSVAALNVIQLWTLWQWQYRSWFRDFGRQQPVAVLRWGQGAQLPPNLAQAPQILSE